MPAELCDRCQRAAPPVESDAYAEWEANVRDDGSVGVICPGCLTGEEIDEIAADMDELAGEADVLRDDDP